MTDPEQYVWVTQPDGTVRREHLALPTHPLPFPERPPSCEMEMPFRCVVEPVFDLADEDRALIGRVLRDGDWLLQRLAKR